LLFTPSPHMLTPWRAFFNRDAPLQGSPVGFASCLRGFSCAIDGRVVAITLADLLLGWPTMNKTPNELAAKAQEIFNLATASDTPMSVLSLQTAALLGKTEWDAQDVERISRDVVDLLIMNGWKRHR
jgi:hypothetical protein